MQNANPQMPANTVQLTQQRHINLVLHLLQQAMDPEDRALFAALTGQTAFRSVTVE